MSGSLVIHTRHERDKVHPSTQGARQDQVHPSEEQSNPNGTFETTSHHSLSRGISLPNGVASHDRGNNTYTWPDGVKFEGEFYKGLESGKGKFTWPNGATYEGNFLNGCLHGVGTYTGLNGSTYSGSWIMNLKHGMGEKHYANGDHYKGNWYQGKREGHGTYTWSNGNTYTGGWKSDCMFGKGMLTWSNGDSFDGNWTNGKEHGRGVYTWVDSGCYVGTWSRGLKDGKGTYYPPGTEPSSLSLGAVPHGGSSIENLDSNDATRSRRGSFGLWRTSSTDIQKALSGSTMQKQSQPNNNRALGVSASGGFLRKAESLPTKAVSLERKRSMEGVIEKLLGMDSFIGGKTILEDDEAQFEKSMILPIVEREYAQGVLISEIVKGPLLSRHKRNRQRQQVKESKRPGETIIKGHRSYDLMLDLQLGIRWSVGKLDHLNKELEPSDFGNKARIWMNFPREGSHTTPCHHSVDFRWKDYCPFVFRTLREMFKIDAADYMLTICGNDALRELSSPGKSGSIFFLSHDDRFLIKTLRKQELKILLKMLPHYYSHVCKYENTLVTKFFGLHRIKLVGGHKVRFVVMGNVFCTELRIHRRFDLKGSSLGRSTDKIEIDETTTLKDLDLDFTFHLEPSWRDALLRQIEDDCNFLVSQQIMDYSLLLGLHFRAPNYQTLNTNKDAKEGGTTPTIVGVYPQSLVLVAHEPNDKTQGSHIRGSSLRAAIAGDGQVDLLAGTTRLQIQLGANMPARAEKKPKNVTGGDVSPGEDSFAESYDVVLCFGIIDILQEYNVVKKIEHAYKSFQFDSVSISAVDPHLYSQRFQEFLKKVFPENLI